MEKKVYMTPCTGHEELGGCQLMIVSPPINHDPKDDQTID